jgi:hypothetical protein
VGLFRKSAGGAALLALIALGALPAGTSGRVTYPGPRFGVPFELRVSGVMQKQWTITENVAPCEFTGTGSQTVTFRTAGWTRARVFSVDRLHPARADFYELEADVPMVVSVTRADNTTQRPSDAANGCGATPAHACGGTRTVTITGVPVRARNHRLELDLMQNGTPGGLASAVDQLYPAGSNCRFPNAEDVVKSRVAWPGNRRFLRPGSHGSFTARQGPTTRTGSVSSSDTQQAWGTSEQYSASFSLRTRNRCRAVSRSVRRSVGYVCNSRNGTVLAR